MVTTYQDPTLNQPTPYTNPTAVNAGNPQFGDTSKFNVAPFLQPFPFEQQKTENQAFNQQFSDFLGGLETPEATRQRFENRYGYQNLNEDYLRTGEAARGVMDQVKAAPENVQARVNRGGTIVNQAQLDSVVNSDVKGLLETYNSLASINEQQGVRLSKVEQNMNEASKLELAQQAKMIQPWLQAYDDKNIMQAREFTGFTFANQMELDRLLANQASGLTWDNAQSERANRLALAEMEYKRTMDSIKEQGNQARETKKAPTDLSSLWSSIMG